MRRIPPIVLLLIGIAICVGLDFGYDALIAADRATSDPIGWKFWLNILVITSINVLGATSLNVVNGVAWGVGLAGLAGGVVLLVLGRADGAATAVAPAALPGGGGLRVTGTF